MPKKSQPHPTDPTLEPSDLNAPVEADPSTADSKAKKPRTASSVQLASRAFQRMCDLQAQRARETTRHAERVVDINSSIMALEAEVGAMSPEVRKLFEGLRAAAEGAK